jgi:prevent-host-death family protein
MAGNREIAVATYSIAQAKDHLSKLIDEALAGEDVTITRHGKPVALLRSATERPIRQASQELVAKIVERAKKRSSVGENAVDIVRRMRDGEWD